MSSAGAIHPLFPVLPAAVPADNRDRSQRVTYTYMIGVYLALNAIRDAFLLIEGPDCVHMKTQFVQGNHDWFSTLTSVSGFHRIANTALHPSQMARSREEGLQQFLQRMASHPATEGLFLTSMPMAFITGADYERLCTDVAEATGKQLIHVPGKSLSGDWLDGYAETLLALARQLKLPKAEKDPNKVGIVGYLYDRNEDDHRANVRDLRALLAALGLETVSIWLEGQSFSELSAIAEAGTLLSFPYGRRAAKALAQRTGARLIECELPFGLTATEAWVEQLGAELGRKKEAAALRERELTAVIPRLEWVIPFVFQGMKLGFVGDPHLVRGIKQIAELLGGSLNLVAVTNYSTQGLKLPEELGPNCRFLCDPRANSFRNFVNAAVKGKEINLLVTNSMGVGMDVGNAYGIATYEFGFPSTFLHHLYDRPFLGFRGFLAFADSLANSLRQQETVEAGARMRAFLGS